MGNTPDGMPEAHYPSHVQPKPQKKRRPSVHSGQLYLDLPNTNRPHTQTQSMSALPGLQSQFDQKENENPNTPVTVDSYHSSTPSIEFGTTGTAKAKTSKKYRNSLEITYSFWRSRIDRLSETEQKETAVLLYVNVFKHIPECRPLFAKNLELQGKHFFGMFRWLITNLKQQDRQRLVNKVQILGELHQKKNVRPEWYPLFLSAFHETMTNVVKEKYTARVRFCMGQLFTVVASFMLKEDFDSLPSSRTTRMLPILSKLRHVLHDDAGLTTLELYMRERFCVEYLLFYRDVRGRFKAALSKEEQQLTGEQILKRYIDKDAECEINVTDVHKVAIYERLNENNHVFEKDVFDLCLMECKDFIKRNIWHSFKKSVMKMAMASVDARNSVQDKHGQVSMMQDSVSSKSNPAVPSTPQPSGNYNSNYASNPYVDAQRSRHQASHSMPVNIDFSVKDMDFSYM